MEEMLFDPEDLREYAISFLTNFEVPENEAEIVADVLISADLRGISSHGFSRLESYYGRRLSEGLIENETELEIERETPTTIKLNGNNGMGQVVGYRAMKKCIEKAKNAGLAAVTVNNSNHFGIAGYYSMMALEEDMIGISLTNSQPLVAPTGGRGRVLGTNPISVAVPAGDRYPYVLDMATSITPMGKVTQRKERGENIPEGWGMDGNGKATDDPAVLEEEGAIHPLGGRTEKMRGYKGYGLSLLVDIMTGVLGGASFGTNVGDPSGKSEGNVNIGHFFAAMSVDRFRSLKDFKKDMDALQKDMKETPKTEEKDRIYIHGEKEFEERERREEKGVPIVESVAESILEFGDKHDVSEDLKPLE